MHEAALAKVIAQRLRDARLAGRRGRPRLLVRGGHDEPADFDASLRLHVAVEAPELGDVPLEIVHLPVGRLCSGCGRPFDAAGIRPTCPGCGSAALPSAERERIELDWVEVAAD